MAFLMVFAAIPAFADDPIPEGTATGVRTRAEQSRYTIEIGQKVNIKADIYLVNEDEKEIIDPNAVIHFQYNGSPENPPFSVDDDGIVTGLADGAGGVAFWLGDDRSTTRTVEIIVGKGSSGPVGPDDEYPPEGQLIAFRESVSYDLPLDMGKTTIRNYITVRPEIPAQALSFSSSNEEVISFDPDRADGMILNGTGTTNITVTLNDAATGQVITIQHEFTVTSGGILADGENEVTFDSSISADNKAALENFLKYSSRLMGIKDDVVEQGLIDSGVDISNRTAYVNFDIKVLSCVTNADGTVSLSMDITPQYTWEPGGHLNPSVEKYTFQIKGPFEMKIPITDKFFKEAPTITHVHEGKTYTYAGSIESEMDGSQKVTYVKFTNLKGFSVFTMSTEQKKTDVPQTGDSSQMALWICLLGVAVATGLGVVIKRTA